MASVSASARFLELLEWRVLRRLDGLLQGDYRTLLRGHGSHLFELREYQPDDDIRHIDWNLTARLQTPFVRRYCEERCLTAWFLVDCSASMRCASGGKHAKTLEFVAAISALLARHSNRIGALLFDANEPRIVPAASGRPHVIALLRALEQAAVAQPNRFTDLRMPLEYAACLRPRRSLVFLVSDFMSVPHWEIAFARLAQQHELIAVRLFDPWEVELPRIGIVPLQDAETGRQFLVDTRDATVRSRFASAARARAAAVQAVASRAGVDVLELATEDDLVAAIARFLARRRGRNESASRQAPRKAMHEAAGA